LARQAAIQALVAVESSDRVVGMVLSAAKVAPEARPFAHELVAGVLRHRSHLDYTLAPLLKKTLDKMDAPVRAALRLAAYERGILQTPAPAVGNEYVELMRSNKIASASALLNAIARRLPETLRPAPALEESPAVHLAIEHSQPEWLVRRWLKRFGVEECAALCAANNQPAALNLRVNTLRTCRATVLETLRERGLQATQGRFSPDAIIVEGGGDPSVWPEWRAGLIIAQDEAAQLVSLLAAPQTGQTIIDAAAAPGGKTTYLAQLMHGEGRIIACDVAPGRLKLVRENAQRLGLANIETQEGDLRELDCELPPADILLLDAPCLGTGTWRRRPDARWRKTVEQLKELSRLQRELLDAAAGKVRSGGVLVYSTCSLEPEENEVQVKNWLERHPEWMVEPPPLMFGEGELRDVVTTEGFLKTLPQRHGCDGMFAVRLRHSGGNAS